MMHHLLVQHISLDKMHKRRFARLDNNIITQIIVAPSITWCREQLNGEWIELFKNHPNHQHVSKGYIWDPNKKIFINPRDNRN